MSDGLTRVDLLRHGEPEGGPRYRGCGIDDPLSETGWAQMWAAVGPSEGWPWQRVISSPLRRCRAFAEALAERAGLPLTVAEDLREIGFGQWEGRNKRVARALDPAAWEAFYADPVAHPPPGAEPVADFQRRVTDCYRELVAAHRGEHLLVVAHAGVMRAIVAQLLGGGPAALFRLQIDYAGMAGIEHGGHFGDRVCWFNAPHTAVRCTGR